MQAISFRYKNHRGEITKRLVEPDSLEFLTAPDPKYGYQPGWFLSGFDMNKKARRSFALTNIILDEGIQALGNVVGPAYHLDLKA